MIITKENLKELNEIGKTEVRCGCNFKEYWDIIEVEE
jgi:hypothetical protein